MQINVNGQPRDVTDKTTIAGLLEQLSLDPQRVAVEHNRSIALREDFAHTMLADGDSLEIVQFVGGG